MSAISICSLRKAQTKAVKNSISLKSISSYVFQAFYFELSGYDLCIITKRLHLAIKKNKNVMTKNHILGLKIKKTIFTQN